MERSLLPYGLERVNHWIALARTDPARVVRCLKLRHGVDTPSNDGNTWMDVYPALDAVTEVASDKAIWKGLVREGVTEALCDNVIELGPLDTSLLPEEDRGLITVPHFLPFGALCNAISEPSDATAATDERMMSAIRDKWPEMMQRIWEEPGDTLKPGSSHVMQRLVLTQLVYVLLEHDPNFEAIIMELGDLTISILVLYWMFSTSDEDRRWSTKVLVDRLKPTPTSTGYNPLPLPPVLASDLAPQVFRGATLSRFSSPAQFFDTIAAALSTHFLQIGNVGLRLEVDLLLGFNGISGDEPAFRSAIVRSQPFWRSLFYRILTACEEEKEHHMDLEGEDVVTKYLGFATSVLYYTYFSTPEELDVLVNNWVEASFLDILERAVPDILVLGEEGIAMNLARIFTLLASLDLSKDPPELAPSTQRLLRSEFPRPRLLNDLNSTLTYGEEDEDYEVPDFTSLSEPLPAPPASYMDHLVDPDDPDWQSIAVHAFVHMQNKFAAPGVCGRRECEGPTKARCAGCKVVHYCGPECQKKDWKEHKLVCKWMGGAQER